MANKPKNSRPRICPQKFKFTSTSFHLKKTYAYGKISSDEPMEREKKNKTMRIITTAKENETVTHPGGEFWRFTKIL